MNNRILTIVSTGHTPGTRKTNSTLAAFGILLVASLTSPAQPAPPQIKPTTSLQHQVARIGTRASFAVTVSGTAPFTYQWRLDGHNLTDQTNRTLAFQAAQPADEGDYTVVVTNLAGEATSAPARLWVVPPASGVVKSNFTNTLGRLPYCYVLPTDYEGGRRYPLCLSFHGTPADETVVYPFITNSPGYMLMTSHGRQPPDPVIQLWPTRRAGDQSWTDAYLRQVSALLDDFIYRFNVDTNRVYVSGGSEGLHAAWDIIALRPGCFAGAMFQAGWKGTRPAIAIKDVPVWAWCAGDDTAGQLSNTRAAVAALRLAGGKVCYTEYATGAYTDSTTGATYDKHGAGIVIGCYTPAIVDWILAQQRGLPSTAEPLLTLTNPTTQSVWLTGATNVSLAGSALALDQSVTQVAWTNTANPLTGVVEGSNAWIITNLPLTPNRTNVVVVTGTTTSWAPACGGSTSFSQTLTVVCSPIQATLTLEGTNALLNWTGGGPPYRIQRATDLLAFDWTDVLSDAAPPVSFPVTGPCGFYRIIGQ